MRKIVARKYQHGDPSVIRISNETDLRRKPGESMINSNKRYSRDDFVACNWNYNALPESHFGYFSVKESLEKNAREKSKLGLETQKDILNLLSRATSMRLVPDSPNEPFKPYYQNHQSDNRFLIPKDFTEEELIFFEEILNDVTDPWLKARLADLLWLCKKPRNLKYAKTAVESYISHNIDEDIWHSDGNDCWERATRICIQIKDTDKIDVITTQLFSSFKLNCPNNNLMSFFIAELMDKLNLDSDLIKDISSSLFKSGNKLLELGSFSLARFYFGLSSKKCKEAGDDKGWLGSLISLADSFEREADSRAGSSNMVANSFYEDALQAYRKFPKAHREEYKIDVKLNELLDKISESGRASLDEMVTIKTARIDLSGIAGASRTYVAGKRSIVDALLHFAGLHPGLTQSRLMSSVEKSMQHNILSNLIGSKHISDDGRIVGSTPSMNLNADKGDPDNKLVIDLQIQRQFSMEVGLIVEGQILPALRQILMEHRMPKELLRSLCSQSPIVPKDRAHLLGDALWLGFEYDFGNSIHLLCPQIEHIVRMQLQEAGANTSNINPKGINHENGLSKIMELPQITKVFGKDLCFELKSIFTDSLGFNLRNEVAHGLLSDETSSSAPSIYAWWIVFKLVLDSLTGVKHVTEELNNEQPCEESS